MEKQIEFILNNKTVFAKVNPAKSLLDFLRKEKHLHGPKEVCKEGDCGACTVLIGELREGKIIYRNVASCVYPMGNVQGKHVVTIEGLNTEGLNFIQRHFAEESAAQCGYCTPGYIASLTSYFLFNSEYRKETAFKAISGNVCRCTGYGSIKRAVVNMVEEISSSPTSVNDRVRFLIDKKVLPDYFKSIPERLKKLENKKENGEVEGKPIGGGTDLLVQIPDKLLGEELFFLREEQHGKIEEKDGKIIVAAETTFAEFGESEMMKKLFPEIEKMLDLMASPLIRNTATLGGNIVNASPIGDFTIILLALKSSLLLRDTEGNEREIKLQDFYRAYKTLDLKDNEIVKEIIFPKPPAGFKFNFEKVSKRTHLDIASVNSAIAIVTENNVIKEIGLSAGGVAPVPKYLSVAAEYLEGKSVEKEIIAEASEIAMNEISPISDVRGSAEYKRLLLGRLIKAHFIQLFPELIKAEELL
jgi:xanthine dehydrogenase small subunit